MVNKVTNVTNGIYNLVPTLRALNLMDKYKDNIIESNQEVINSFNDKFNFLVGNRNIPYIEDEIPMEIYTKEI
jgi:hypothetical protein